jgi:RimJ/RimL family protein N-acetyltransferase
MPTAYRIETPRLVLRPLGPGDEARMAEAVETSLEHLRAWLPWAADEPLARSTRIDKLRQFRANFDLDIDHVYGIFDPLERVQLGAAGLHARVGPSAVELGYWIRASHVRQGFATEAASALVRVALDVHHARHVEIRCDPAHHASASLARGLGFTLDATLRRRDRTPEGRVRDTMVWSLFADELAQSPAVAVPISVYDGGGAPLSDAQRGTQPTMRSMASTTRGQ